MRKMMFFVAAAAAIGIMPMAHGAVTLDGETGTGFVGKGDVQLAFGWNNKALQDNASGVTFRFHEKVEYVLDCQTQAGKQEPQQVQQERQRVVNGTIQYDARTKNQITGFNLTGFGALNETGQPLQCTGPNAVMLGLLSGPTSVPGTQELKVQHGQTEAVIWQGS